MQKYKMGWFRMSGGIVKFFEKTDFAKLPESPNKPIWPREIFNFASKFLIFAIFLIFKSLTLRILDFEILNPTDFSIFDS